MRKYQCITSINLVSRGMRSSHLRKRARAPNDLLAILEHCCDQVGVLSNVKPSILTVSEYGILCPLITGSGKMRWRSLVMKFRVPNQIARVFRALIESPFSVAQSAKLLKSAFTQLMILFSS